MTSKNTIDNFKEKLPNALYENNFHVADTCFKLGVPRASYYKWLKDDPDFKEAVAVAELRCHEKMSKILWENALDKKESSVFFYLNNRGKDIGYGKRPEDTTKEVPPPSEAELEGLAREKELQDKAKQQEIQREAYKLFENFKAEYEQTKTQGSAAPEIKAESNSNSE